MTRQPALGAVRDVATGAWQLARGIVPLRRATPRRLVRMAVGLTTEGLSLAGLTRVANVREGCDVVLVDRQGPVTAEELDRWSTTVAAELTRREVLPAGHHLGLLCHGGRGLLVAAIATTRLGGDAVLLHPDSPPAALAQALRQHDVHVVAHDEELTDLLAAARFRGTAVLADATAPGLLSVPAMAALPQADIPKPPRLGQLVVLTSPSGPRPSRALPLRPTTATTLPVTTLLSRVPIGRGSAMLILPPLHHAVGLGFMGVALGRGCRAIVPPRFDPDAALALIEAHGVETLIVVPTMLQRLVRVLGDRPAPPSLRAVVCSGGPLLPNGWRRAVRAFGPIVNNLYGSARTGWCTLATPSDLVVAPGTIGRPAAGVEIEILDDAGRRLPPGTLGRVFAHGPRLRTPDDSTPRHGNFLDTGDLGRRDAAGYYFVEGRGGDVISDAAGPVMPGWLEDALLEHAEIAEAAVTATVPTGNGGGGRRILAMVVPTPGACVDRAALAAELAARAGLRSPVDVEVVDAIPLTDSGQPLPPGAQRSSSSSP